MSELNNVIEELKKIKDDIYNNEESTSTGAIFKNLVKLNNIESTLYEILVLMYSNSKAEIDAVRFNHLRHSTKIIDSSISIVTKIEKIATEINYIKNDIVDIKKKRKRFFNLKNIIILTGIGLFIFVSIASIIHFLPNETNKLLDFILNMSNSKLAH